MTDIAFLAISGGEPHLYNMRYFRAGFAEVKAVTVTSRTDTDSTVV